jgi:hypothetical protein
VPLSNPRRAEHRDAVLDIAEGVEGRVDLGADALDTTIVLALDVTGNAQ